METILMNTENEKANKPGKFVLNSSQKLHLRSSNKLVTLQYLPLYYTWKKIRKQYKNNKFKITSPTWNGEFELLDGSYSMSDIQHYIEYIIKKLDKLKTILPIHFPTRINDRLSLFKLEDE